MSPRTRRGTKKEITRKALTAEHDALVETVIGENALRAKLAEWMDHDWIITTIVPLAPITVRTDLVPVFFVSGWRFTRDG